VYDDKKELIKYVEYIWDSVTNDWKGTYNFERIYDDDSSRKLNVGYSWDDATKDWKMTTKHELLFDPTYSVTNLLVPNFLYFDAWHENTYFYNHENMLTKEISSNLIGTDWMQYYVVTWYWSPKEIETGILKITNTHPAVRVYPNPASSLLTIETEQTTHVNYGIYSLTGQLQMQGKLQGETTTININSLPKGIYLLKISEHTVKIIKH